MPWVSKATLDMFLDAGCGRCGNRDCFGSCEQYESATEEQLKRRARDVESLLRAVRQQELETK